MTNRRIMETPDKLLTSLERQKKYLIGVFSQRQPCPSCGTRQNLFEASGFTDIDQVDMAASPGRMKHECISCKRELIEEVPFVSVGVPWHWALVPIPVG